jgi:hypothetical protein
VLHRQRPKPSVWKSHKASSSKNILNFYKKKKPKNELTLEVRDRKKRKPEI